MRNVCYPRGMFTAFLGMLLLAAPLRAQTDTVVRIIQTNSAGTNAHLIDPATHEVVGIIEGVSQAHAAVDHPEGYYYYFANELDHRIDVVDTRTLRPVMQIPLRDRPNKLVINEPLRKLYVGIRDSPWVEVFDLDSHERIKSIRMVQGVHNVYVTADGRYVIAGLGATPSTPDEPTIQVIDANTDEIAWSVTLDGNRVRPMALESNPDGSTNRIFAQATRLNGFYVVDWDERKAVDFISPPHVPVSRQNFDGIQDGTGHGLLVLPDQSAVWYASRLDSSIYGWSLPDLEFIGGLNVGPSPQWLTATPDSRFLYVSIVGTMETLVVDLGTLDIAKRIPVGHAPKRNSTHRIPADRAETLEASYD